MSAAAPRTAARRIRFRVREAIDDVIYHAVCTVLPLVAPRPIRHLAWLAGFALALGGDQPGHWWLEHLAEHDRGNDRGAELVRGHWERRGLASLPGQIAGVREDARDDALYDVGRAVLDMRAQGLDDREVLDAVLAMVQLRMVIGLPDPVGELTGGGDRT